jgi:hypothetical protein
MRPSLNLDFANTQRLDPRITWSRADTANYQATRINQFGLVEKMPLGAPRFDFDPVTMKCKGLLIEESSTNLLLNSENLSTQNVTVSAVAHTISFYGTGSITLSGTHTATVNSAGAYPARATLTFTPTAGTLTVTVTGTVQYAQLEAKSFATSWINTAGAAVTRAADIASMTGTNFSSWYRQDEGTILFSGQYNDINESALRAYCFDAGAGGNNIRLNGATFQVLDSGAVTQASIVSGTVASKTAFNNVSVYKLNDFASSLNGAAAVTDTSGTVAVPDRLILMGSSAAGITCGHIARIAYFPKRLDNATIQELTRG